MLDKVEYDCFGEHLRSPRIKPRGVMDRIRAMSDDEIDRECEKILAESEAFDWLAFADQLEAHPEIATKWDMPYSDDEIKALIQRIRNGERD